MRILETHLKESQFLSRIETLCKKKTRFSKGYANEDAFVYIKNNDKIILCKHYATIGKSDGYAVDCLQCYYFADEKGHLTIKYKFGKMPFSWIPFLIAFSVGVLIWIALLCDCVVSNTMDWGGVVVASVFWIFGLFGLFGKSKKERVSLETHLFKICETNITDIG